MMNLSPELGEQDSPRSLPPVLLYRPGKEAVPHDAEVVRPHPPLYAGDFNNRKLKDAYYWEGLDRNNREDEKLRLGLHYGEERNPRCDLCEKEDRACMSLLGKKYKTTGCAFCIRRHFQCSQANGVQKTATVVRKDKDPPFRPSGHAHKRAFNKVDNREGTEPPAKRTRASMNGKAFDFHELPACEDNGDEYHTPLESRRGSVYALAFDNQGGEDSYKGSLDPNQAEGDQSLAEVPQPDVDDTLHLTHPNRSDTRGNQPMSSEAPTNNQSSSIGHTQGGSSSFEDLSRYFSNHDKLVRNLQSANGTLTERVGQLESSHNCWQDVQSRVVALESMPVARQETQQEPYVVTLKALDSRVLKLEKEKAGLSDGSLEEGIKRLESIMEKERRERRALANKLEGKNKSLTHDVAVLQSENEGLRERLNSLTKKLKSLDESRASRSSLSMR
ncbi:unnamed protein product [Aureobasidium uvarum]|uniref:Uncharacterized protein n=1 Tax=Aureobasidium uvarum TaxID=2773716 RepID=A0A9N8KFV1_9PEZI|nr:unnamed protein product [Aureobasidium uvarum]